jgi:hypothetical protein
VIAEPNDGQYVEAFAILNAIYKIVLRGNQTSDLLTIFEEFVYTGDASRCYYHTKQDETIHVLNGTLQFYVGGKQFCAPTGTSVYIPRNVTQSHRNLGSKSVHIQLLFSPLGIENYLDKLSPIYAQQPVNLTEATKLAREYGVVHLPDIEWKDLNCAFNGGALFTLSFYLTFLTVLLYVLIFVY